MSVLVSMLMKILMPMTIMRKQETEDIIIAAGESTIINLTASNATGANAAAQFASVCIYKLFHIVP